MPTLNEIATDPNLYAVGKGAFKGNCFNCGKPGHRAADCEEPRRDGKGSVNDLNALNYKGKGKGKGGGYK